MARCEVVQVKCDRCGRLELRPPATPTKSRMDFDAVILGEKITYSDLCDTCKSVVVRCVEILKEWDHPVKNTLGPTVHSNQAPPLQVAPNYTPPQPHSATGGKR